MLFYKFSRTMKDDWPRNFTAVDAMMSPRYIFIMKSLCSERPLADGPRPVHLPVVSRQAHGEYGLFRHIFDI